MTDLISKKTRTEFREYFVGTTLRKISEEFDAADVPFASDYSPPESGQRRSLVEQYYHAVDFSSWRDVQKVLRVYESVLIELEERVKQPLWGNKDDYTEKKIALLIRCLDRDGFVYSDGRISASAHNPTVEELSETASNFDSKILRQQIDRIRNAIENDPDLAIGTAKELVETTCRTILADYGITADTGWDVTRLVKETRGVLKLVPEDIPDSAKGAETIKRMLSNLGQISQGIAELRNLYGTGHGKDGQFKGLSPRHARLVAGCATILATFLFETHEFRKEKTI
ncbi:MAG TPA: hypothetical protein DEO33_05820 [Rikenellaceae bacterium]|nr:hypothetical protein [Rikenellaceae bacterium]